MTVAHTQVAGGLRTCRSCGEVKPADDFSGPAARSCVACREATKLRLAFRICRTCGERKPTSAYASSSARRCELCWDAVRSYPCRGCGGPTPVRSDTTSRWYCDAAGCQRAKYATLAAIGAERRAALPVPTTHVCPACAVEKPLRREDFSPISYSDDGTVRRWDAYCRPCRNAEQRNRYHSDPGRRAASIERAQRQRAEIVRRRLEDPVFDREYRERKRLALRRYRAKVRRERATRRKPTLVPRDLVEWLPAGPLADAVLANVGVDENVETACGRAGVNERQLFFWRSGWRPEVALAQADAVLLCLGLCWWEVWNEETVRLPIVTAILHRRRAKRLRSGRRSFYAERGRLEYGDAGPDLPLLARIEALWQGSDATAVAA